MAWTAEERAELGQRLHGLAASAGVPEAILAARVGNFRYRHGWIPIAGDKPATETAPPAMWINGRRATEAEAQAHRDAEDAAKAADAASVGVAKGTTTHGHAAAAHARAARALFNIDDAERARDHVAMARLHKAQASRPV
jgi:hypothetical protein